MLINMGFQFCHHCHIHVDTEENPDHFDEGGNCVEFIGYQLDNSE